MKKRVGLRSATTNRAPNRDMTAAQRARKEQTLNKPVRLPNGEIVRTREFLDRLRAEGGILKIFRERQYGKIDEVAREIALIGRNVPFGNPDHPDTKSYYKKKLHLEASLIKELTGVQLPDGAFFELNKTELDYFSGH